MFRPARKRLAHHIQYNTIAPPLLPTLPLQLFASEIEIKSRIQFLSQSFIRPFLTLTP